MYAGTKNKFYEVYFISSRNSISLHPHEHKIAAFIIMTERVHNVCTDNERLEEVASNNGYTIKNVQGHYNKIRNKRQMEE
jgi:hypothetical protein